jgi:hypothetical protein
MADQLYWTKTPPGQPGFYWYRVPGADAIVLHVEQRVGVLSVYFPEADIRAPVIALAEGEWAGPIELPVESH